MPSHLRVIRPKNISLIKSTLKRYKINILAKGAFPSIFNNVPLLDILHDPAPHVIVLTPHTNVFTISL